MDAKELSLLASMLGAYPPLTEDESAEVLSQVFSLVFFGDVELSKINPARENEINFEEFWIWWVSEEIEQEVEDARASGRANM